MNRHTKNLDLRLAEAIIDHDLKIERLIWLSVMQEGDENWEWLKDEGLDAEEKELKEIFGKRLGDILHGHNEDNEYEEGCDTLARAGGWLFQVSCRPPDPEHVFFKEDGSVGGYMCAGYERMELVYAPTLAGAVCKGLRWKCKTRREAIAKAREIAAKKEKTPKP